MSQDRFDQWLRNQVDEEIHPNELNAEWMKYELRMDANKRRRRGAIWWWITGWAILMVVLSLTYYSTSEGELLPSDSEIQNTQLESQDKTPLAQFDNQNENSSNSFQVENLPEASEAEPININKNQYYSTIKNNSRNTQEARVLASNQETIFLSQFASSGTPISSGEPEDVFSNDQIGNQSPNSKMRVIEMTDILPVRGDQVVSGVNSEQESIYPSEIEQRKLNGGSIWSITSVLGAGKSYGRYSGGLEIDGLNYARSFQEVLGLEVMVWRHLGSNWKVGAGLGVEYQHHQIAQGNQVSERGSQDGHVTDITQMQDGSIQRQSGTATGIHTTTFDRTLHHEYISTSIPIGLAYENQINSSWILGARVMLQPTYYHHRLGMDVQPTSSEPYWSMDDLSQSFESSMTLGTGGSLYLGYCLSDRTRLTLGVGGRTEISGSRLSADRTQYLSSLQGQLGLQIDI